MISMTVIWIIPIPEVIRYVQRYKKNRPRTQKRGLFLYDGGNYFTAFESFFFIMSYATGVATNTEE